MPGRVPSTNIVRLTCCPDRAFLQHNKEEMLEKNLNELIASSAEVKNEFCI